MSAGAIVLIIFLILVLQRPQPTLTGTLQHAGTQGLQAGLNSLLTGFTRQLQQSLQQLGKSSGGSGGGKGGGSGSGGSSPAGGNPASSSNTQADTQFDFTTSSGADVTIDPNTGNVVEAVLPNGSTLQGGQVFDSTGNLVEVPVQDTGTTVIDSLQTTDLAGISTSPDTSVLPPIDPGSFDATGGDGIDAVDTSF